MSVHSKAPNAEKGRRYLAQLDQALCNGNWADVHEPRFKSCHTES
jgi:cargo-transport protein YPP1